MNAYASIAIAFLLAARGPVFAQQSSPEKPPVGVPADAKPFNGNWYRVYLEVTSWKSARTKCERLGGQLAVLTDEPESTFVGGLSNNLALWIGGFEKVEGLWEWVDGSPMQFKNWAPGQPNAGSGLQMLHTWHGAWGDTVNADRNVVGYICEWKPK